MKYYLKKKSRIIIVLLTLVSFFMLPGFIVNAHELSLLEDKQFFQRVFPSATVGELENLQENLDLALRRNAEALSEKSRHKIIDVYSSTFSTNRYEINLSENIVLEFVDSYSISKNLQNASQPYTLTQTSSYVIKDALIPVEALRFNLSCSYQYKHATDVVCTDVSPGYSSTLLGILYNMSYENIDKGKTGLEAWGKATFTAKVQIAGNYGITLHNLSATGKIRVIPTEYDTGGWYFTISKDWS